MSTGSRARFTNALMSAPQLVENRLRQTSKRNAESVLGLMQSGESSPFSFHRTRCHANVVLLSTSTEAPRNFRIARTLAQEGHSVCLLEWDRESAKSPFEVKDKVKIRRFKLKAPYGMKAILFIPVWMLYVIVFLVTNKFDVVQPQNLDNLMAAWFASKLKNSKIVYDLADFYSDAYIERPLLISKIVRWFERRAIKGLDNLILVSEGQIAQVGDSNMPIHSTIIYNTVPDKGLDPNLSSSAGRPNKDKIVFLYAGIFTRDRLPLLLNLAKTLEDMDGFELLIAGRGQMEGVVSRVLENAQNVRFLGFLDHADVMKQTSLCDCVVIPYDPSCYNNVIGLPNKFFEALVLSKPVLAQKGTNVGRIVQENDCGFITDFRNAKELKNTLKDMKEGGQQEFRKMGLRARKLYLREYNWSIMETKLLQFYDEILDIPPNGQLG